MNFAVLEMSLDYPGFSPTSKYDLITTHIHEPTRCDEYHILIDEMRELCGESCGDTSALLMSSAIPNEPQRK